MKRNKGYIKIEMICALVGIIVLIALIIFIIYCVGKHNTITEDHNQWVGTVKNYSYLVYDRETRIIYYKYKDNDGGGYQGYGYMAPYYSSNGKLCKYVNDKIIEIKE